jgi:F-type H+-transporting ATPase subunit b
VLTAVVTQSGAGLLEVQLATAGVQHAEEPTAAQTTAEPDDGPSPITPEKKELAWGAGAFIVFAVVMRYFLYPRLRKGMDARYAMIRSDHETAEATTAAARAEVAEYESELARVKAEAGSRIETARQQLETERAAALGRLNAEVAERRAAAQAEVDAARVAVRGQVADAVGDVVSQATHLALGHAASDDVVRRAVDAVMSAGAAR